MYVLSIPEMATEKYMHSATEDHDYGMDIPVRAIRIERAIFKDCKVLPG
jgi:hypothetical protein